MTRYLLLVAAAGVTVASMGECDGEGQACGGMAGDTCMEGEFCKGAEGMCGEDAEGMCTDMPMMCPSANAQNKSRN